MIQLRLSPAVLARMRFAYSPLAEAAKSLYVVHSGRVHPLHRGWYDRVRPDLHRVDGELLRAVVPPGSHLAEFLFVGATGTATSIHDQLELVAGWPPDRFAAELRTAWRDQPLSSAARRLLDSGADGPGRAAEALDHYWQVAIAPYWPRLRAVLDADVAYRVRRLARGGIAELMLDLHPSVAMTDQAIRISSHTEDDIDGHGLTLVPCVFVWPRLWVELGQVDHPSLTYGARGIGTLWLDGDAMDTDPLADLLGRSRAEILARLARPQTTTELAHAVGISPATVSSHLGILHRSGLVSNWRSGRRVLYQQTPIGTTIVAACGHDTADLQAPGPA